MSFDDVPVELPTLKLGPVEGIYLYDVYTIENKRQLEMKERV